MNNIAGALYRVIKIKNEMKVNFSAFWIQKNNTLMYMVFCLLTL